MAEGPNIHGQGPEAGWYPNPEGAGLRWWDGTAWTAHVHGGEEVVQPFSPSAQPSPAGDRRPAARTLVLGATLIAAAALAAFLLLRSSGDGSSSTTPTTSTTPRAAPAPSTYRPPGKVTGPRQAFDALAMKNVHTGQIAIETYASENGGSYSGATPAILRSIEPVLPETLLVGGVGADHYSLTMPSESGARFTIDKKADGTVVFACAPRGRGGCPRDGTWE